VISIMPGVWSARETPAESSGPIAPGLLERAVAGRHTRSFPIVDVRDVARAHIVAMDRGVPGRSISW